MIKLSNNSFISSAPNDAHGDVVSLDSLEEKLLLACKSLGYLNSDLSQDILSTVVDYVVCCQEEEQPLTLGELEKLVFRILCNTGCYDVAHKFGGKAKKLSPSYDLRFINPDKVSIKYVLSQNPLFQGKPVDGICDLLFKKLSTLGLEKITDKLLIALAENISITSCLGDIKREREFHVASHFSIMSHSEISALLNEDEIRLIKNKIVMLRPISLLLPVIKVRVFVLRILGITNEFCFLELKFYPAFNEVCSRLKNIMEKLVAHLHKAKFPLTDNTYKIEVLFDITTGHSSAKKTASDSFIATQVSDLNAIASHHFRKGLVHYLFV